MQFVFLFCFAVSGVLCNVVPPTTAPPKTPLTEPPKPTDNDTILAEILNAVQGMHLTCNVDQIESSHPDFNQLTGRWYLQMYSDQAKRQIPLAGWIMDLKNIQENVFMHRSVILNSETNECHSDERGVLECNVRHNMYKNAPGIVRIDTYLGDDQQASRESNYYKILFVSKNYFILYGCDERASDGTCMKNMDRALVFSRDAAISDAHAQVIRTMLMQTCVPTESIVIVDLGNPCMQRHMAPRKMFDVREGCGIYDNTTGEILDVADWVNDIGYGVAAANFNNPKIITRKGYFASALTKPGELAATFKCGLEGVEECVVHETIIRNIPENKAIQVEDTSATEGGQKWNIKFWFAKTGAYRALFGCQYSDTTCDSTKAHSLIAHRYKTSDKVDLHLNVFDTFGKYCIDPETMRYTQLYDGFMNLPTLICKPDPRERSCMMPVPAEQYPFNLQDMVGSWFLVAQTHRMYYRLQKTFTDAGDDTLDMKSSYMLACTPECTESTGKNVHNERNMLRCEVGHGNQEPKLDMLKMLHLSDDMMLWHACLAMNDDQSCRLDRTYVMLWAKTPAGDKVDMNLVKAKLDEVCVDIDRLQMIQNDDISPELKMKIDDCIH